MVIHLSNVKKLSRPHYWTRSPTLQKQSRKCAGMAFFNRMRDLTASGFWSSEMGTKDIGYLVMHPINGMAYLQMF